MEINRAKLSPMMQKYFETKDQYPGCILFYRLGDFYEMFFDDAITASKALEITLTGKECGLEERAPMCGVPFHAADNYIDRLVKKGYRVAIAEQMEDPKLAKGLVKREVIRVVTPGTICDNKALDETNDNYIMSIAYVGGIYGVSTCDVSTGEFYLTELKTKEQLEDELFKFTPAEVICNDLFELSGENLDELKDRLHFTVSTPDSWYYKEDNAKKILMEHFHTTSLLGIGLEDYDSGMISAGALMQYLYDTQKSTMPHITNIQPYTTGCYMIVDTSTRRNLELTETLREKEKRGSLLWVLDKTKTAMGARLLRSFIEQPLIDRARILKRQEAIEELLNEYVTREEIREYLQPVYDLERLAGRISYKTANPRDLLAFAASLRMLPPIKQQLADFKGSLLKELYDELDTLDDLESLISSAIIEDPPLVIREGGIIKDGYNEDVDKLRRSKTEGKNWLAELEAKERERTGIKTLRVRYNKVFGYYIEVTNSFKDMVPDDYTRKQTLTNAERFITQELKELEDLILGAEDKLAALEYELFCDVRDRVASQVERIQKTARAVALLDVIASLSFVAERQNYVKPQINERGILDIKNGRHPVVEQMIPNDMFVANDVLLDNGKNRISIITGPNMAGKSTDMRQVALIALMAQIGSFVPAKSANICISDRIFTRVGASDDLASGQSTFMVEMNEVANILRHATKKSLIILDEIGRGTSTYDGMSIAWAVVEYIADARQLGAKTLFATHYHELTELEGALNGVNNYCIAVKEQGDDIVFLRKIVKGGADRSYGIQVAKLAGVPDRVINRAKELVEELTDADIAARAREIAQMQSTPSKKRVSRPDEVDANQLTLFDTVKDDSIIEEIKKLEIANMTPLDALNTLYRMQATLKNRI